MGLCTELEDTPLPITLDEVLFVLLDLLETGEHIVVPRYPGALDASTCWMEIRKHVCYYCLCVGKSRQNESVRREETDSTLREKDG